MPAERYRIRVTKDYLVFCCAHFITYGGTECERLHGHNYRAAVEIEGILDENSYVFDFVALKHRTRDIVDEIDHHMLLATENPLLPVVELGSNYLVKFGAKEWSFPREDCRLLEIANTTTELLAKWLAMRVLDVIRTEHGFEPEKLAVELEECIGQSARYEWSGG